MIDLATAMSRDPSRPARPRSSHTARPDEAGQARLPVSGSPGTSVPIHLIELPKFRKALADLETARNFWLDFLKNGEALNADALPEDLGRGEIRSSTGGASGSPSPSAGSGLSSGMD